jgi:hypothetical protein
VVWSGDQSFELELDMEVSAKTKAHCVDQVEEECQCVLVLEWGVDVYVVMIWAS